MTPQTDYAKINRLLALFDAGAIGEGDTLAGANTLAALAITIANISGPEAALVSDNGTTIAVGTSFIAVGDLTENLVNRKVCDALGDCQANLNNHVCDYLEHNQRAKTPRQPIAISQTPVVLRSEGTPLLVELHGEEMFQRMGVGMGELFKPAAHHRRQEVLRRSNFFITGRDQQSVEKQCAYAHLGYPIIHLPINTAQHAAQQIQNAQNVTKGFPPAGVLAGRVRGHVVITVSKDVFERVVRSGDPTADFLSSTLLLTDGTADPALTSSNGPKHPMLDDLSGRTALALETAGACRFDFKGLHTAVIPFNFEPKQREWLKYLRTQEKTHPGIMQAAWSLLVTLYFGLYSLANAKERQKKFMWHLEDIVAFAQWLVQRMLSAHAAIRYSDEQALLQGRVTAITLKLQAGPLSTRDLIRRFHRLSQAECLTALEWLSSSGLVVSQNNCWALVQPPAAHLSLSDKNNPNTNPQTTIDV